MSPKTITEISQQFSIEAIAVLMDKGQITQAREILSRRIIDVPDDYKARLLLRDSFFKTKPAATPTGFKSCPCCNNSFPFFLPGGPSFRPNACCPACESLERHRSLCLILKRLLHLNTKEASMIHVAPEQSLSTILRQLFEDRYYTMDLFTDADIRGDLCEMPFGTDSIDIFMANHVLEHIKDDLRAMREIYRILKPQGSALLQIPIDLSLAVTEEAPEKATPQDILKLFGQEDHVRQYGTDFKDRLEQSGFTVRTHICHDIITPDEIKTYGLHSDEIVWEAFKS